MSSMNPSEEPINPYASPNEPGEGPGDIDSTPSPQNPELKEVSLGNALSRWTLICAISAAPSFFLGFVVTRHFLAVPMMLLGVSIFAISYAYIDRGPRWRRWMSRPLTRNSIMWAYGIRMTASVLFPVGMYNDMIIGLASVSTVSALFSGVSGMNANELRNPLHIFLTTILQGTLLNLEIFLLILVLIGLNRAYFALTSR